MTDMILSVNNYFSNIFSTKRINDVPQIRRPSFKGVRPLENDKFEFSNNIHLATLKDMKNNDVNAFIIEKENNSGWINEKKFIICTKGDKLGYATVRDNKDNLYLTLLYTQEHEQRSYKGAGTALLRCVVEESIKRGYEGRVKVQAYHCGYSPLVFYYKNNFVIPKPKNENEEVFGYTQNHNAAIHYALMNNIPVHNMLLENDTSYYMELTKEGAKAFLKGIRLCNKRSFEKVAQENIKGKNCSANLIQSPYKDEYILLIANEDKQKQKSCCFVNLLEKKNKITGKKYFIIRDIELFGTGRIEHAKFAFKTLKKIEQEKNYDETTINKKLSKESKELYAHSTVKFKRKD